MLRPSKVRAPALCAAFGAAAFILSGGAPAHAGYVVTNLVSDGSVPAKTIDPSLINPWGISYSPTGPFWVSDNNSGVTTLYNGHGAKLGLTVGVAPPPGQPGAGTPTGQVFNGSKSDFQVSSGGKTGASAFLFATEDGTISGWSPPVNFTSSVVAIDNSQGGAGAVYKGLAIGSSGGAQFLYAANFRSGQVEMYNAQFGLVKTFTDPGVAAGYAPFNTQVIGNLLYVTFALQNAAKHDDVAGAGHGYVDAFNLDGTFNHRIVSLGGAIDSPWGLDIAPSTFGAFANDLLVGNFGDGTIGAFDPITGMLKGDLTGKGGAPIVLNDLWGLINGNGGAGGAANKVYFTTGVQDEAHGLFGSIEVPEPASLTMAALGLGGLAATIRTRARKAPRA